MVTALDCVPVGSLHQLVAVLPQRSEALARFAALATERALTAHRNAGVGPATDDPVGTARLARLFATRLAYLGERPEDAIEAARFAVQELTAVTEARTDIRAELAESHAALALALDLDPTMAAAARTAGAAAVDAYRILDDPSRYGAGLATALHNQSIRLLRAGETGQSLANANEAHAVVVPLHDENPTRYRSLYADVLDNLSAVIAMTGDLTDAERLGRDALTLRQTLAAARPDAYRPQLAGTLHNLGLILARQGGDLTEAWSLLTESVALFDDLAVQQPGRFEASRVAVRAHLAEIEAAAGA
jgi:hypothetical protein